MTNRYKVIYTREYIKEHVTTKLFNYNTTTHTQVKGKIIIKSPPSQNHVIVSHHVPQIPEPESF